MGKAPPAFQFYPSDFLAGTLAFTTFEVGGYFRLLCHQWENGSIPGDDLKRVSQIMGCSLQNGRQAWAAIGPKFVRSEDGWRNARMETVRAEQEAFRLRQLENGRKGGRPRKGNPDETQPITQTEPTGIPTDNPNGTQTEPLRTPISTSKALSVQPDPTTSTPSVATPERTSSSLITNSLRWDKAREKFAFYGSRLRIPHVLHDECRAKLGGESPTIRLLEWYGRLDADVEVSGEPIPDVFTWLRPKFVEWASAFAADAELEKFRPKGA